METSKSDTFKTVLLLNDVTDRLQSAAWRRNTPCAVFYEWRRYCKPEVANYFSQRVTEAAVRAKTLDQHNFPSMYLIINCQYNFYLPLGTVSIATKQ